MPLRGAIDLGTNTCLLVLANAQDWSRTLLASQIIQDHLEVVRLGEGVAQSGALQPEPMRRALAALSKYAQIVHRAGIDPRMVRCVATAQARSAANGTAFFDQVQRETGFVFRIISGAEEARLTFRGGLLPESPVERSAVIDIGGGSTEFATHQGGVSLPLGSVRMTELHFGASLTDLTRAVTDAEFWSCQDAIDQELSRAKSLTPEAFHGFELIGVAGTVTTIAQWHGGMDDFDPRRLDGMVISRGDVHRAVEEFKWRSPQERRQIAGMDPKRADVILAGSLILWRAMEHLGLTQCRVSTRGLRFGALTLEDSWLRELNSQ